MFTCFGKEQLGIHYISTEIPYSVSLISCCFLDDLETYSVSAVSAVL